MTMPYKNNNDCENAALFLLIAQDDENAFTMVYEKYSQRIYAIAMRYLKCETIAQEVVQDVFMKLWSERSNIKSGIPIDAWLYTVAKNNTINRLKRMANEHKAMSYLKITQKNYEDSAQNKLKDNEGKQLINTALKTLSKNQLKVYQMVKDENLSYLKVAEQLNISPLTVKTHMARALGNLRLFFARY